MKQYFSKLIAVDPNAKAWDIILAVCAIASIVPLFCARHLPMSDLPEHLAAMATIRHYGDPAWKGAEYFTVAGVLDTPYWLYHGVGALLSVVTGSAERANIVMMAVAGLGYPYAMRSLLRALNRDPRLAIFGCALFWTTNLIVGILNFVASVPVVLLALALVIQHAEKPTFRRAGALALLSIAIFYLHLSSYGLFILDAAILTWILPRATTIAASSATDTHVAAFAKKSMSLLWLAPSAVIGLIILMRGHTVRGHAHGSGVVWGSKSNVLHNTWSWLFDVFRSPVDNVLGVALVILLGGLIAIRFVPRGKPLSPGSDSPSDSPSDSSTGDDNVVVLARRRARALSYCVYALAASAFLARLLSPTQVGDYAFLLDTRMAVFVGFFAIALPRVFPSKKTAVMFASAALVTLGLSFNAAYEVHAFETEEVAGFDDLLRAMPHGKRLVMLNFEPHSSHLNANVFNYFGSYYRARYGGVASFSFSETSHWPVQYRPGAGPPTPMAWGSPCAYRNRRDGAYFDYVLTRGERDPLAAMPVGPRWELVGGSRSWRLFKKVDASIADGDDDPDAPDVGPCGPPRT